MQGPVLDAVLPILLLIVGVAGLAAFRLLHGNAGRPGRVKQTPYESGRDPILRPRPPSNVPFPPVAIAYLVFVAGLLLLYPWAVAFRHEPAASEVVGGSPPGAAAPLWFAPEGTPTRSPGGAPDGISNQGRPPSLFAGGMVFVGLLVLGFIYGRRKGIFQWH
jgi:NADH:ubiquinone oxidoreductase subunit 3 (subunit A)